MKLLANPVYRFVISICAISIGIVGFGLGYNIILMGYKITQGEILIFIFFVFGVGLMFYLSRWKGYYANLIKGDLQFLARAFGWCFFEGFALSFVAIPFGAILLLLIRVFA